MTLFGRIIATAAVAGGLAMLASAPASAYVVCNPGGDCWHSDSRVHVPGVTFSYHPDDWYFHRHWDADHWHDWHDGRGYWRNGIWVTL